MQHCDELLQEADICGFPPLLATCLAEGVVQPDGFPWGTRTPPPPSTRMPPAPYRHQQRLLHLGLMQDLINLGGPREGEAWAQSRNGRLTEAHAARTCACVKHMLSVHDVCV